MGDAQEVHFGNAMTLNGTDGGLGNNICRDFLRKVCHRGTRCKFVHPEDADADDCGTTRNADPIFCHDFQNSECLRPSCKFLHCTRQEEDTYRTTGRLPVHVTPAPSSPPAAEPPVCKDFLKGECRRAGRCKFRHIGSVVDDEPEAKRRALDDTDLAYRVLQQENAILRRKIEEMKKQVADLTATNEFLLEQNAVLRFSKQTAATTQPLGVIPTAALQPVAPLASTADLTTTPQSVTPIVPVVPVSISSSLPASLSQSLAQTIITMSSPSAPLVSYPVMTQSLRPVIAPRMGH